MPARGFLSYSHQNLEFCRRLLDYVRLKLPDSNLFMSQREIFINNFLTVIIHEIKIRPIFIVVLSSASVESPWVKLELSYALRRWATQQQERVIIPIMHEKVDVEKLHDLLDAFNIIDCTNNENDGFEKVVQTILGFEHMQRGARPVTPPNLQLVLEQLAALVQELTRTRGKALFADIGQELRDRSVDYSAIGFRTLIREAEVRGIIRVDKKSVDSYYALPTDYQPGGDVDVPIRLTNHQLPAIPGSRARTITPEQLLPLIDFLEKSLPYVNRAGIQGRAKKALAATPASVNELVDKWLGEGDLITYSAEMCTNDSGVVMRIEGLRLNPGSALVSTTLKSVYAKSPQSWSNLSLEQKSVFVTTYLLVAEENRDFYWHTLRAMLVANDAETNWDWVFATAVDADVMRAELYTLPHHKTGTDYTIKRITLNKENPEVKALLQHGIG